MAQSGQIPLKEFLIAKGWVRPSEIEILKTERITPVAVPEAAREALSIPERRLDEYILVSMIGRGGMGEVLRVVDDRPGPRSR